MKPRNKAADVLWWMFPFCFSPRCSSQPFLSGPAKAFGCAEILRALQSLVLVIRAKLLNSLKEKKKKKG